MGINVVNRAGLEALVGDSIAIGVPLFIEGTFGIGKTDVVSSKLKERGFEPITWFRGSHATPDTIAGVPYLDDGQLRRAVPELIAAVRRVEADGKRPALFLDELNLSSPNTLAALLQLLLEKRLGEYALPGGTPIIAAGNLETDGSVVSMLPLPAANRMAICRYAGPTFAEWEEWAVPADVHPLVLAFLKDHPGWLVLKESLENGAVPAEGIDEETTRWPTPRSWAHASKHLKLVEVTGRKDERLKVLSLHVGDAAALRAEAYIALADKMVPVQEVFDDPEKAPLPSESDVAVTYMTITSAVQRLMLDRDQKELVALLHWTKRQSDAITMMAVSILARERNMLSMLSTALFEGALPDIPEEAFELLSQMMAADGAAVASA